MKIVSVIPIKLNNERLPGKNTMILGGKPLITYIQETLLAVSDLLDKVYVYCSDPSITSFLLPNVIFLQRDSSLDLPSSNFTQIFQSFSSTVKADVYLYAHATAPFVSEETVRACLEAFLSGQYDSAFCAEKIQDYLWRDNQPLNFDASNMPRSQDLPVLYRETSGIYTFQAKVFSQMQRRIGEQPYIREVTRREAVDINTAEDFRLAEALLEAEI